MVLLALSGEPVDAGWVPVEKDDVDPGRQTVYLDPDTVIREESLVTVRQLTDYKWMQGNVGLGRFMPGPHRFFSTMTRKQFDCGTKRVRLLAFTEFSGHMGTGIAANGYVDQDAWLPVEPESINHALWEWACTR
ncbi:MAG: hypothetical protein HP491_12380 [Nitrospira sp.]|nr:hypothetical protein [Nitrospira sp.]MBH0181471.1 hypothetical protein [Nitrospira sp.]